jgi:hypothetical protein
MILGQSAATAAALALDAAIPVQQMDYEILAARLLNDGQILDIAFDGKSNIDPKNLSGLVMDNPEAKHSGPWGVSSSVSPMVGLNYLHDAGPGGGPAEAKYDIILPESGRYEVRVSYSPDSNRASNVLVTVHHADGTTPIRVNQQRRPEGGDPFLSLGEFAFVKQATVVISNRDADGYVIADAVQVLKTK